MDYTAAHLFEQMQAQLEERGGTVAVHGNALQPCMTGVISSAIWRSWVSLVKAGVMVSETLDSALEWMEERILEVSGGWKKDDELAVGC